MTVTQQLKEKHRIEKKIKKANRIKAILCFIILAALAFGSLVVWSNEIGTQGEQNKQYNIQQDEIKRAG